MAVRRGTAAATFAALGFLIGGCSEPTFGPVAVAPVSGLTRANVTGDGHPPLHSNSVRYRNNGAKPWTGRSGSASLMVRALLGRDGMTQVDVSTGDLDSPSPAPGNLAKVQTKAFGDGGGLLYTQNHNGLTGGGTASFNYPGLMRGWNVQVQANVRGIDPKRTDVVTVMAAAMRRPDLRASDLQAPSQVVVNSPIVISATISEINGDVGARANCVMYVDGAVADHADGIWVDAGDAVACAFTQAFTAVGTRNIEVRAEHVVPGDDDLSNNAVSGSIAVVDAGIPMQWSAYAIDEDYAQTYSSRYSQIRNDGVVGYENGYSTTYLPSKYQSTQIYTYTPNVLPFPLHRVELSVETGGNTFHSGAFDDLPADYSGHYVDPVWGYEYACVYRYENGYYFNACAIRYDFQPYAYTSTQYYSYGQVVTYHSTSYNRYWDHSAGYDYTYTYNNDCEACQYGVPIRTWGNDVTIRVSLDDGSNRYVANAVVPLTYYESTWDQPEYCYYSSYDIWNYSSCYTNSGWAKYKYGNAYGP